jgi:hypothetical protein
LVEAAGFESERHSFHEVPESNPPLQRIGGVAHRVAVMVVRGQRSKHLPATRAALWRTVYFQKFIGPGGKLSCRNWNAECFLNIVMLVWYPEVLI